jgi:dipeptidyl aminopeptidase/acylaminoacyl peptidase
MLSMPLRRTSHAWLLALVALPPVTMMTQSAAHAAAATAAAPATASMPTGAKPATPPIQGATATAGTSMAPDELLPTPESIVARHVPAIPRAATEELRAYENMRSAAFADWDSQGRRMLILTRFGQAAQVHEVAAPGGARSQVTFYDDQINTAAYRPGDPSQVLFSLNPGGSENFQLMLLDRRSGHTRRITDGVHRHQAPLWSRSGKLLAYLSNARNGRDFDLYVADPSQAGSERRVAEHEGDWETLDWSPDDRRVLLLHTISVAESYLQVVDIASGKVSALTPRRPGPTAYYQMARWAPDGASVYTASNREGEFLHLVRLDVATGAETALPGALPWDVESLDLSSDGARLAFFANEEGVSRLHVLNTATGAELAVPELPQGVATEPRFRRGTHELAFALSWARAPFDVYSCDVDAGRVERWTASETGGLDPRRFAVPALVRYPTFDTVHTGESGKPGDTSSGGVRRTIPAFVYRPDATRYPGPRPVYITIHGGPEAQTRPNFLGSLNYLVDELGVAIIAPNVRGSSGYGKTYLALDNADKREDSVKDIGALLDWIATQPDLDASHVMVAGGSYGGYMTLAAMTHYSNRLACGFDTVGISNFVTFLEHTQSYRRDLRRVEYGDERDPKMRQFLESIAPLHHAGDIRKPLLVAGGANDPRVPLSESDQIVAAVEANGIPVWYVAAKDEGHGYQKKVNVDYLRTVSIVFLKTYLLNQAMPAGVAGPAGAPR